MRSGGRHPLAGSYGAEDPPWFMTLAVTASRSFADPRRIRAAGATPTSLLPAAGATAAREGALASNRWPRHPRAFMQARMSPER